MKEQLLTLSGVGPKVADCILLFSTLKRFEVFPIDVWVRRVMNDLYIKQEDETKVSKKQIAKRDGSFWQLRRKRGKYEKEFKNINILYNCFCNYDIYTKRI